MLKSVCCFVFISAVILAVHSQNASSSNTLDVGVSSGKGLLASVNDETDVKNKDAAIPETGKGLLASANNVTDLKNEDAAIPEPGKGLQAIVNNQTILNPGGETNTDVVQKNESPAKEQNKKVDSKVENINPGTGNIPFGHCITCSQTNSTSDKCLHPSRNESSTACDNHNNNQCYTKINPDGFVRRGCADELGLNECSERTNCAVCKNKNCNNKIYPTTRLSCLICGPSDKNCSDSSKYVSKLCPKYIHNEKCYTADHKGNYERGCLSETKRCLQAGACNLCSEDGCNKGLFNSANGQYSAATMISFLFISFTMILVNK